MKKILFVLFLFVNGLVYAESYSLSYIGNIGSSKNFLQKEKDMDYIAKEGHERVFATCWSVNKVPDKVNKALFKELTEYNSLDDGDLFLFTYVDEIFVFTIFYCAINSSKYYARYYQGNR